MGARGSQHLPILPWCPLRVHQQSDSPLRLSGFWSSVTFMSMRVVCNHAAHFVLRHHSGTISGYQKWLTARTHRSEVPEMALPPYQKLSTDQMVTFVCGIPSLKPREGWDGMGTGTRSRNFSHEGETWKIRIRGESFKYKHYLFRSPFPICID